LAIVLQAISRPRPATLNSTAFRVLVVFLLLACRPPGSAQLEPARTREPVAQAVSPLPTATPEPEPTAIPTEIPAPTPAGIVPSPAPLQANALPAAAEPACPPAANISHLNAPLRTARPGFRPVVVQIDNAIPARPPLNLSRADAIYEYVAEGGVTRFSALYTEEDPGVVGPVRSARLASMEIARQFDALLVYHGASTGVQERIWNGGIYFASFNATDSFSFHSRLTDRPAPHNSITTLPQMRRYASMRGVPPRVDNWPDFPRGDLPVIGATGSGRQLTIGFAGLDGTPSRDFRAEFRYVEDSGFYQRSTGGVPSVDGATGRPIVAETVVIQVAPVLVTDIVEDMYGSLSLDYQLQGEGPALFFRSGQMWRGCWRRPGAFDPTTFLAPDGAPFPFGPGPIWIAIATPNTPISRV
jgi:hypothetical protein